MAAQGFLPDAARESASDEPFSGFFYFFCEDAAEINLSVYLSVYLSLWCFVFFCLRQTSVGAHTSHKAMDDFFFFSI